MFTIREQEQFEAARKFPAEVLLEAVKEQARNSIFSEAYCLELAGAYTDAGETARERRIAAQNMPKYPRTYNMTIAGLGDEIAVDRNL